MTGILDPFNGRVRLAHGAGGRAMRDLILSVFLEGVSDPEARALGDAAVLPLGDRFLVVTTDAHVVKPAFFPGGDIGRLAICGVVNDLAMLGCTEVAGVTSSVIIEEGFPIESLQRIHRSMLKACEEGGTRVITGDTKVMQRGEIDGVVLSSSAFGVAECIVRDSGLEPGDAIIVTGTIGDHGLAVLSARHELGLEGELTSDVAPINDLVRSVLRVAGPALHAMKDPTRGGVTSALVEMAEKAKVSIVLDERAVPISPAARAASELLGIDPLCVANEGKALLGVQPGAVDDVLAALRAHPLGLHAARIGAVLEGERGAVVLDTGFGKRRLIERDDTPLPRIC
ncbi:MAG TPA: hydrogenase expression/formation protein HypE [Polyangiaceae bacterium]|nr:hydrogenase expression/formation protein HypE [Polyangiaceae bacterium]